MIRIRTNKGQPLGVGEKEFDVVYLPVSLGLGVTRQCSKVELWSPAKFSLSVIILFDFFFKDYYHI